MAFTWVCEHLTDYLIGLNFHIQTDHKPLVPLFSAKDLEELPVRVHRFQMRMMRFNYTISHVPGKELTIADSLSRAPVSKTSTTDQRLQSEVTSYVHLVVGNLPQQINSYRRSKNTRRKTLCVRASEFCKSGWPEKRKLSAELKPYKSISDQISVVNGLLLRGNRIIIPQPLRKTMLEKLHSSHQGVTKCRERARQSVWWPGFSKQLNQTVQECPECVQAQSQRSQPLNPTPLPQLYTLATCCNRLI